jgi:flavin reductase (DIM6/NTAB) family NADH-FMN oxidoreductase RutF
MVNGSNCGSLNLWLRNPRNFYRWDKFVLNILKEGMNLRRHFLKPFAPGEDRFADLNIQAAANGCSILSDALAYANRVVLIR